MTVNNNVYLKTSQRVYFNVPLPFCAFNGRKVCKTLDIIMTVFSLMYVYMCVNIKHVCMYICIYMNIYYVTEIEDLKLVSHKLLETAPTQ